MDLYRNTHAYDYDTCTCRVYFVHKSVAIISHPSRPYYLVFIPLVVTYGKMIYLLIFEAAKWMSSSLAHATLLRDPGSQYNQIQRTAGGSDHIQPIAFPFSVSSTCVRCDKISWISPRDRSSSTLL